MDLKSVKQLAALMQEFELGQLEIKEGDFQVSMSRQSCAAPLVASAPAVAAPATLTAPLEPAPATPIGEALNAPLVGVAYMAENPDAAPFVTVGQPVTQGQVLCILEAMKVMNEFTAPRAGIITEICIENKDLVEFGQCLFRLQ